MKLNIRPKYEVWRLCGSNQITFTNRKWIFDFVGKVTLLDCDADSKEPVTGLDAWGWAAHAGMERKPGAPDPHTSVWQVQVTPSYQRTTGTGNPSPYQYLASPGDPLPAPFPWGLSDTNPHCSPLLPGEALYVALLWIRVVREHFDGLPGSCPLGSSCLWRGFWPQPPAPQGSPWRWLRSHPDSCSCPGLRSGGGNQTQFLMVLSCWWFKLWTALVKTTFVQRCNTIMKVWCFKTCLIKKSKK